MGKFPKKTVSQGNGKIVDENDNIIPTAWNTPGTEESPDCWQICSRYHHFVRGKLASRHHCRTCPSGLSMSSRATWLRQPFVDACLFKQKKTMHKVVPCWRHVANSALCYEAPAMITLPDMQNVSATIKSKRVRKTELGMPVGRIQESLNSRTCAS